LCGVVPLQVWILNACVQYAGNVLVFGAIHPCDGDWFGGLSADNAAEFLEGLVNVEVSMAQLLQH